MKKAGTKPGSGFAVRRIIILLALLGVFLAWHWTPLNEWLDFETVAAWERSVKDNPAAPYIIIAAYLLGGLVFFPVTLLTVATIFTFGPALGNAYALAGWLLSAALGYGMGRVLGRDLLRNVAGSRLDRLDREAGRNGLVAVLTVRSLPIAPFTLVNLSIGASRIRFCDFILGSLLGRIPGLLALTLFELHIESLMRAPAMGKFALLIVMLLFVLLAYRWLPRHFGESLAVEQPMTLDAREGKLEL